MYAFRTAGRQVLTVSYFKDNDDDEYDYDCDDNDDDAGADRELLQGPGAVRDVVSGGGGGRALLVMQLKACCVHVASKAAFVARDVLQVCGVHGVLRAAVRVSQPRKVSINLAAASPPSTSTPEHAILFRSSTLQPPRAGLQF